MVGIDISQWQASFPDGAWEFAFCRATHDTAGKDPKFQQHWEAAAAHRVPHRGAYHFASPAGGPAAAQAALFVEACIRVGFAPGRDLWALDMEANSLLPAPNGAWVDEFMRVTAAALGGRGFLYVGWYYASAHLPNAEAFLRRYNWWLPAYGPNDGQQHAYEAPFVPVLHQFTSKGGPGGSGLDLNAVTDAGAWQRIVGAAPAPAPHPAPAPKPSPPTVTTTDHGDTTEMKITDVSGIHLDDDGNGVADVGIPFAAVLSTLVIGGNDPLDTKRYDPRPTADAIKHEGSLRLVLLGGVPKGTYTVRVAHV